MGTLSLAHWAIVAAVVSLLFGGRNRVSSIMGDVAKGIRTFRREISDMRELTDVRLK